MISSVFFLALLAPSAFGQIVSDFNCTIFTDKNVYAPTATVCSNTYSDATCALLYPPATAGDVIAPDTEIPRPVNCWSNDAGTTFNQDMKDAAIASCAKTCGYCCQTDAYSCENVQFPRLKCDTITSAQCDSPAWRTIIAQDCPSACGFCNEGGCVDAVTNCATDMSICQNIGMQDFVNSYCQKTCGRCASSTTSSSSSGSGSSATTGSSGTSCTTYDADTVSACTSWAANGFCTNSFYTTAQRKARCATTCKIC
uniref:ShKT domain-containing protein n=1 Tax=Caenorhabditis japonica TaxID=281687 RepID=A0A8R1HJS6_CAEJA